MAQDIGITITEPEKAAEDTAENSRKEIHQHRDSSIVFMLTVAGNGPFEPAGDDEDAPNDHASGAQQEGRNLLDLNVENKVDKAECHANQHQPATEARD